MVAKVCSRSHGQPPRGSRNRAITWSNSSIRLAFIPAILVPAHELPYPWRPLARGARVSAQHPIGLVRSESERATVEKMTNRRFGNWGGLIVGNAKEVAAELSREAALGVEMFILQFHDHGDPATMEAFTRDVIPLVVG